jgi:protein-disulfide isomerase
MSVLKVPLRPSDHVIGDEHAPVILLEYGDYECPHCGRAHPIVKAVRKHFGKQMQFAYRHFPLTQIHPFAAAAAETAEFAGAHGRFWQMHELLFENQDRLDLPLFFEAAKLLGLSADELKTGLESRRYAEKVREDFMSGVRSGVNGTPTFFVNGHRHEGTYEYEDLIQSIERELVVGRVAR